MIPVGTKVRIVIPKNDTPFWNFYSGVVLPKELIGTVKYYNSNALNNMPYLVEADGMGYNQSVPERAITILDDGAGSVEDWM